MYMTRVLLNRVPPPNIIHGVLSAAFPGKRNEQESEGIWRIDRIGEDSTLLLVSKRIPEREKIISEIGGHRITRVFENNNENDVFKTLEYDPFLQKIEQGQMWSFRLCANPVEHKRIPEKRGKVYALQTVEKQLEWLRKQGEKHGFDVINCSIANDSWKTIKKVHIRAVTFEGLLTVHVPELLRTALMRGIGRGKAYGCGLLTIARANL
jgi:CRISPR system Cascade subunit CasE